MRQLSREESYSTLVAQSPYLLWISGKINDFWINLFFFSPFFSSLVYMTGFSFNNNWCGFFIVFQWATKVWQLLFLYPYLSSCSSSNAETENISVSSIKILLLLDPNIILALFLTSFCRYWNSTEKGLFPLCRDSWCS